MNCFGPNRSTTQTTHTRQSLHIPPKCERAVSPAPFSVRRSVRFGVLPLITALMLAPAALASSKTPAQFNGQVKLSASNERTALGTLCVKTHGRWFPGAHGTKGEFISDVQLAVNYSKLAAAATRVAKRRDLALATAYQNAAKAEAPVCTYLAGPQGVLQLATSAQAVVESAICGKVGGSWAPVTQVAGAWIADNLYASDYEAVAGRTSGKIKRNAADEYQIYKQRASQQSPACAQVGVTPAPVTPAPLKFSFAGAVGLALASTSNGSIRTHADSHASTAGSNLDDVSASGQLTTAVVSGSVTISHFYIAPDDEVFVVFNQPVNLGDPSTLAGTGTGCLLAEVDPMTGTPTCVDSSLSEIDWPLDRTTIQSSPIQFDSSGAIYYLGTESDGTTVLRRDLGGVISNLITDNVSISNWLVLPNGTVFLTGETLSTGVWWTRLVTPGESLETLATSEAHFLTQFPDSNVYMGLWGPNAFGVARYLTGSNELDPKYWISDSAQGPPGGEYFNTSTLCPSPSTVQTNESCEWLGSYVTWAFASSNGDEFVLSGDGGSLGAAAMEYYPTVAFLPSEIQNVTIAEGVNNDLILAGTDAGGNNVLTLFDTDTKTETQLLGPSNQIEIYHLSYNASDNSVWFDGLQFSDNQYVIGNVDLSTDAVTVVNGDTQKWADLQAFGG